MKLLNVKKLFSICFISTLAFSSCSDGDDVSPIPEPSIKDDFHIAFASGTGSESGTYLQGVSDLSQGTITSKTGKELESSRTARIFVSSDGATIYSLNYTEGTIEKLAYHGKDQYTRINRMDASVPLGVKAVRMTKLNDEVASVHYISSTPQYDETGKIYQKHKVTATIGLLDLAEMVLKSGYQREINVDMGENLARQGYHITRIDAPVLSGNKLYYGAAVSKFNPSTGKAETTDRTFTLVIDYPSLTNATVISRDDVKGATNGYRTPTQHKNEAGDILQMVSGNNETHILKIKNGKYDTSFKYSLSELLGKPTKSNGWFYAGNGIGYIPYEDLSRDKIQVGVDSNGEPTYSAMWKLARMDFNKNTVVDLNVPDDLWLTQYQTSVVRNGIFYIALSPVGINGNIYMFNVSSESKNGTLGTTITGTGADQYYIGIY